jgi:heat shock protein HslJ
MRRGDKRSVTAWGSLASALVLLVALGACGSDSPSSSDEPAGTGGAAPTDASNGGASGLSGTSWDLAGVTVAGKEVAAVGSASLAFAADGKLSGTTGCNQFGGTYEQSGDDLTITLGPTTLVACTDAAATAQEQAILSGLPKVASYTAGDTLVLKDASGATLLTYEPGLASLEGTAWHATGINNGKDAVAATTLTESVTAEFGAKGALSGFAGCNQYNATYQVSGSDAISITGIATTRKACEDDAMTLEQEYVAALGKVATYEIAGDRLTLRDEGGSTQVTYVLTS